MSFCVWLLLVDDATKQPLMILLFLCEETFLVFLLCYCSSTCNASQTVHRIQECISYRSASHTGVHLMQECITNSASHTGMHRIQECISCSDASSHPTAGVHDQLIECCILLPSEADGVARVIAHSLLLLPAITIK